MEEELQQRNNYAIGIRKTLVIWYSPTAIVADPDVIPLSVINCDDELRAAWQA